MAQRRQRTRVRAHDIPGTIVLDSGALSAAARGDDWVQAELTLAEQFGIEVHVSSVTLAETLRAHRRDARVHAVLGGALPNAVPHQLGRGGGELLGRTGETTPWMPSSRSAPKP